MLTKWDTVKFQHRIHGQSVFSFLNKEDLLTSPSYFDIHVLLVGGWWDMWDMTPVVKQPVHETANSLSGHYECGDGVTLLTSQGHLSWDEHYPFLISDFTFSQMSLFFFL